MLYDKKWELDEVGKCLLDAREYIRKHGWCQGEFFDQKGQVCLAGAIIKIKSGIQTESKAFVRVQQIEKNIAFYNDSPDRTKEEVMDLLEKAAYQKD